jgi:hypothetical protein
VGIKTLILTQLIANIPMMSLSVALLLVNCIMDENIASAYRQAFTLDKVCFLLDL